jgi:hypothetical protein
MIRKVSGKYKIVSLKGKPLGTYASKKQAVKRLQQIEYFKAKGK